MSTTITANTGGMKNSSGTLVCEAQLVYDVTISATQYVYTLNVYIHNVRYGYKSTGTLSSSLSCSGQTTYTTSKGDCNLSTGGKKLLNGPRTYTFNRTTADQTFTINFSVASSGNTVSGTSSGTLPITVLALEHHYISYKANNGDGTITPQTKYYGQNLTLSNGGNFSRTNYSLTGWNTNASGTGTAYGLGATFTTNLTSDLDLYAQWKLNYVKPTITNAQAYRTNSSGTADANGTYIKVSFTYTGGHQASTTTPTAPTIKITINTSTTTTATATGSTTANSTYTSGALGGGNCVTSSAYTVTIQLYDSTDTTGTTVTLTVGMATIPIDLLVSGNNTYMGLMTAAVSGTVLRVPSLNSVGNVTVSGTLYANGGTRVPKITASTSTPSSSDGANGDVWLVYS